jgi:hypothetical protein
MPHANDSKNHRDRYLANKINDLFPHIINKLENKSLVAFRSTLTCKCHAMLTSSSGAGLEEEEGGFEEDEGPRARSRAVDEDEAERDEDEEATLRSLLSTCTGTQAHTHTRHHTRIFPYSMQSAHPLHEHAHTCD